MTLRHRIAAVGATLVLLPAVAAGSAGAQIELSDPPPERTTTTPSTTTTSDSSATTTPTTPTTTTPEITAAQAGDGILLSAEDRVDLASSLADTTEESGVCFGYRVRLGGSGASSRDETLSNAGPDREPTRQDCPRGTVLLNVFLTYTSSSSEQEDSASWSVVADAPGAPLDPTTRLRDLTNVDEGDLLGDDDDLALRNLAAGLPLLLDGATPAQLSAPAASAPNGDRLTGSPGGDWLRAHGLGIVVAFLLLLLAVALILGGLIGRRQSGAPALPLRRRRSGSDADGPPSSTSTT